MKVEFTTNYKEDKVIEEVNSFIKILGAKELATMLVICMHRVEELTIELEEERSKRLSYVNDIEDKLERIEEFKAQTHESLAITCSELEDLVIKLTPLENKVFTLQNKVSSLELELKKSLEDLERQSYRMSE